MADEAPSAVPKIWSDERVYFTAFWIGVLVCVLFQTTFLFSADLRDPLYFRIQQNLDGSSFSKKLIRNAVTALPIAGYVAVLLTLCARARKRLDWIIGALMLLFVPNLFFQFSISAWGLGEMFGQLAAMLVGGVFLFLLRKNCDRGHDLGFVYVLLILLTCEYMVLRNYFASYNIKQHLNIASAYSVFVIDGLVLLFVRKLQNRRLLSEAPPRFHFSLRALMILILTAGAWASLIVFLHRKA